ncbi:MAG: PQQ-binding-like beta-propeller repeat protein [Fuerstiella sp.]|jgi:outer membrane protein assembly factor BamB|nr:PQQ-binding-like beta-propeller repeat protein [Fuerstiella sp.]
MFQLRCFTTCFTVILSVVVQADDDWPMWRYDTGHTASSANQLPDQLHLRWTRDFGRREPVWDDPLNHDLMPYDRVFEPVVKDGRVFIGFNDSDKVVALSLDDGSEIWTYYTDGPVRFPPVAWKDRVICVSDDGFLHCVGAADGRLIWKVRGGPSGIKVLGNKRIISAWPARGGAVVADDTVYFAASIWPFMGTFIYAIDPADGRVIWVNEGTSADYIKQPHSAPSFGGVAPQGTLSVSGDCLLVPGGRSVPAVFDRTTGDLKYFDFNAGGKGNGGSLVIARGDEFFVHTRLRGVRGYDLNTGKKTAFVVNEPVLTDDFVYSAGVDDKRPVVQSHDVHEVDSKMQKKKVWEIDVDGSGDLILAGATLYAAGRNSITSVKLADDRKQRPQIGGSLDVDGDVLRLLAANGHLIASTRDGRLHVFGEGAVSERVVAAVRPVEVTETDEKFATSLIRDIGAQGGYVLWFGAADPGRIAAALQQSELEIVIVDESLERVSRLRRTFDAAGLYGRRVSAHVGTPLSFQAPPYIANAVVVAEPTAAGLLSNEEELKAAFESVRPYGSSLIVLQDGRPSESLSASIKRVGLENAAVSLAENRMLVTRVGALKGAADWTHQYGDIANTVKSDDSRVRLPLGVLWFGGNSNMDILPRHGHGPPEQVVEGRLYVQGMNSLSCRDVYTGRVLWQRTFEDLGTGDLYFDDTYKDTPLDTAYNQVHIPGANGRGTNYVVRPDAIYLAIGSECQVLDPLSGKTRRKIALPAAGSGQQQWGYIGVYEDVLLAGNGFANYRSRRSLKFAEYDKDLKRNSLGFGSKSFDVSASAGLVAFDRHTGQQLWQLDATHSFLHNGIVAGNGRVYCLDKLPKPVEEQLKRRGRGTPGSYQIVAVDVHSGKRIWENSDAVFGSWLSYSTEHDLLLQAGASASDRLKSEVGAGMAVHYGTDGTIKWRDDKRAYSGPCILHGTTILTNANSYKLSAGAFSLLDGKPEMTTNPLTGQQQAWQVCRAYGCNNIIASENMLTFRSGAAGYYDLTTRSGTGNLGGFKSGCTSNLVVANGVLNAPDYTRTCSCAYQNQTSLGLVHMPKMEIWTVNHEARLTEPGQRLRRIGINLGAPGDRTDEGGTLWMEYPTVGGEHADLDIKVDGEVSWYCSSSLRFSGEGPAWIGASGAVNVTRLTIPMSVSEPAKEDAEEEHSSVKVNLDVPRRTVEASPHTVRLHFCDPGPTKTSERVFSVSLQGQTVIDGLDIVAETGRAQKPFVREFRHVSIGNELIIDLSAQHGQTVLCGVEIVSETE